MKSASFSIEKCDLCQLSMFYTGWFVLNGIVGAALLQITKNDGKALIFKENGASFQINQLAFETLVHTFWRGGGSKVESLFEIDRSQFTGFPNLLKILALLLIPEA